MAEFIWLVSYPKSGNTWLRALLANYLNSADEPVNINELGGPVAAARVWFDEWSGIESSALDDVVIERLRPEVYRCLAREEQNTLYMKVHEQWHCTDRGEAMFPSAVTAGVVYIIRNPLDMASSCAHHWGVTVDKAVEYLCDPDYTLEQNIDMMAEQLRQRLGSWSCHVESWVDASQLPVHLVRYEDLLRDPVTTFGGIVSFCRLPYDAHRLRKVVAFSDFSELQRQEQSNGFRERSVKAPGPFFRRGKAGSWREELPSPLADRLIAAHRETMRRFGYLDDNYQPLCEENENVN